MPFALAAMTIAMAQPAWAGGHGGSMGGGFGAGGFSAGSFGGTEVGRGASASSDSTCRKGTDLSQKQAMARP